LHYARSAFQEPQPVLELRDSQLQLVPFVARHHADVPENRLQRVACAFPDPDCVAAPARRRIVDPTTHLVLPHTAALGE
jgi:hypothetical protein